MREVKPLDCRTNSISCGKRGQVERGIIKEVYETLYYTFYVAEARTYHLQYGLMKKYCVECLECDAELPMMFCSEDEAKAIAAWNRRHEPSAEWLRHEDSDVWECSACHTCFELDKGVPADKLITYCPVCGTRLYMPE